MTKTCCWLLAGGLAAQHTTLPLLSDHCLALLVASILVMLRERARAPAVFVFGYALFVLAGQQIIETRLNPAFAGDSMLAKVRITDFPSVTDQSAVMDIEPIADVRIPRRTRVSWFEPPVQPQIGDTWELELRLRRPRGTRNPGVFDYESWMFREGYRASGYVVSGKRNRLLTTGNLTPMQRLRANFLAAASTATDSDSAVAVLGAIGVGARHAVTREQWDRFAATGTSHLMAISGLHIGLAALAAFAVAFVLLTPLLQGNGYVAAVAIGTFCALAYALVSGLAVPSRRAIVMLAVVAYAVWRRRLPVPSATVALAAIVVFLTDPIAAMTPGFHLSFAAVVLLLWLARRKAAARPAGPVVDWPRQLLVMQVFLLFGLLPLTALIFQRFTPAATPANLVAVPLFSFFTVPLTLAGMVSNGLSPAFASFLLGLAAHSIDGIDRFIGFVGDLPFASIELARVEGLAWAFFWIPLLWVILPRGWPGRRVAVLGIVALATFKPPPPPDDCFDTWILDVGQGLSVAIQTHDDFLLYDTGMAWRTGGSVADQVILPFLHSRGIRRVDWLVVSHSDLDHSGGVQALRSQIPVADMLVGEPLDFTPQRRCIRGMGWSSGGIRFSVLHPGIPEVSAGNASSCVLRVSAGDHALLLTGDIEASTERMLVQQDAPLAASIAVVPHHGSTTSSTVPFVDSVYPDFAVVSAGHANRWGFPKTRVVERWEAVGAEVLNTARSGALYFEVCAREGVTRVLAERDRRHRFWHAET